MKIASLDGLRGVAAILVVLFHENYWFSQTGLVPKAYLAVDFFFCLSGFIIAYSYSEHLISGQLSFLKFSAIRLVRLYPLYLLGTVLGLLRLSVQIAIGHPAAPSISNFLVCVVTALLFLPSTSPRSELYPANSLAWSLGFELAVNLAYAAVLPYLTPRRSAIITSACCLTFTALVFVKGSAEMGPFWIDFAGATFRTLASFSIGVTVFNFRNRIMMRAPPIILMIVLAMFLAAPVVGGPFFDLAFCFAVSPALVAVAANSTGLKWENKVFLFLGTVSYPIYMLHVPIVSALGVLVRQMPGLAAYFACGSIAFFVSLAAIVDRVYDQPIRKMLRGILIQKAFPTQGAVVEKA